MTHSSWNYVNKRVLPCRTAVTDDELSYSTLVILKFMAGEGSLTSIEFSLAATGAVALSCFTTLTTTWHLARHIPYTYFALNKNQDDRIKQRCQ